MEIKAPWGSKISCKNWGAEAAMRMLMNNLDREVAEKPEELIVYGGIGKAARNWDCYHKIVECLKNLEEDETLLIQSGKPVAVFKTHSQAPRVLLANSLLVPKWATWEVFRELDKLGLIMYGQMTAGSWIYIGTQGILQGTYETFAECARQNFGGSIKGKLLVTAGLGGMGGAQPLACTMNEGTFLAAEVDEERIKKRILTNYLDEYYTSIDEAINKAIEYKEKGIARSVGVVANAAELLPRLIERNIVPDVLTDQTSAHDELNGYVPMGMFLKEALELRKKDPETYIKKSYQTMAIHVKAMLKLQEMGAITFDYGNNIRAQAKKAGIENAFSFQGFVPLFIRPLFCKGSGPFRWVALSGDPEDIYKTDEAILELFPENKSLERWIRMAREKIKFQGLPARICWLAYGERDKAGLKFNELVRKKIVKAPIVIGRDHLDSGSVASPNRETEGMKDSSDPIADWPILNALLNTAAGASWVSVHHGGGVGMGYSIHSGMVVVADGTKEAKIKLSRVLKTDPGLGIVRHADAGYEEAIDAAKKNRLVMPMLKD